MIKEKTPSVRLCFLRELWARIIWKSRFPYQNKDSSAKKLSDSKRPLFDFEDHGRGFQKFDDNLDSN